MHLLFSLLIPLLLLVSPFVAYGEEVLLSWDQNPEEELAGYNVYYGNVSGVYFEDFFTVPKERLVEVDGRVSYQFPVTLSSEKTYYFAITAYDKGGYETGFSNEVRFPLLNDTDPPVGSVIINSNDLVTYTRNVILNLFATDDDKELGVDGLMTFSNDSKEWSDPEPYTTAQMWTLSPGDGIKTVYVKFSDAAGNWMIEPAQDQIIYEASVSSCDNPQNLQPASITASSQFLPFCAIDNAIDGNPTTTWSTFSFFRREEFITLDLGELKRMSSFTLYAAKLFGTDYFPANSQIQVSRDNLNWMSVNNEKGYVPPIEYPHAGSWNLPNLACRYIRIYITKAKTLFFFLNVVQIAEIEVYGCDMTDYVPAMGEKHTVSEAEKEPAREEKAADLVSDQSPLSIPGKPVVTFK